MNYIQRVKFVCFMCYINECCNYVTADELFARFIEPSHKVMLQIVLTKLFIFLFLTLLGP